MKSMAKAVIFGSFILATQAAMAADVSAFPGATDEAGVTLAPRAAQAGQTASAPKLQAMFPGETDDAGATLPVRATYADTHPVNWDSVRKSVDTGSN